jgi:hypothetical protein
MLTGSRISVKDIVHNFLSRCFLQNPSRDELAIKLIQAKQNAIHIREETIQMGRVALEAQDRVLSLTREKYDLKSRLIKTNRSLLRAQSRLSLHGALQYVKETIQDDDEIVKLPCGTNEDPEFYSLSQNKKFQADFTRAATLNGLDASAALATVPSLLGNIDGFNETSATIAVSAGPGICENQVFAVCFLLRRYDIPYRKLTAWGWSGEDYRWTKYSLSFPIIT